MAIILTPYGLYALIRKLFRNIRDSDKKDFTLVVNSVAVSDLDWYFLKNPLSSYDTKNIHYNEKSIHDDKLKETALSAFELLGQGTKIWRGLSKNQKDDYLKKLKLRALGKANIIYSDKNEETLWHGFRGYISTKMGGPVVWK